MIYFVLRLKSFLSQETEKYITHYNHSKENDKYDIKKIGSPLRWARFTDYCYPARMHINWWVWELQVLFCRDPVTNPSFKRRLGNHFLTPRPWSRIRHFTAWFLELTQRLKAAAQCSGSSLSQTN